jgi:hypothetical protein
MIEYVAYTPSKVDKVYDELSNEEFYLDEELIAGDKMKAGRNEKNAKILRPRKPPGYCPKWDYYDFGVSSIPIEIKDLKEYIKNNLPRAYKVAIRITDIQKIESKPLTEFGNFDNSGIGLSQLENSFIVAHTKNDYKKKYSWI